MAKIKIPTVADDVVIDIQIHETFYRKLVAYAMIAANEKSQEDFRKALLSVKDNVLPTDTYTLGIHIVSQLILEIETMAKEQNKTKEVEMEIPDPPNQTSEN